MRLRTLPYLMVLVMCLATPSVNGQRRPRPGGKNKCKKFNLDNGKVRVKSKGRLAKLSCKRAYTMIEGDRFLSCVRQKWTGDLPKCIKGGCEEIYGIANGEAVELFQGGLMQIECKPGYVLNGSPSLACDGRNWNASIPFCGHRIPQEEVEMTCDFEDSGICGWEVENSPPNQGWKRRQGGPTMPGSTTPSTDHSTGTNMGHFMLVDAAAMGTKAQLFSPVFSPPTEAPTCFVFYYYIQKHAQSKISVLFKSDNVSIDSRTPSINLTGDSGRAGEDGWTMYYFDLNDYIILEQHFQIILDLLPGQGYNSDVAIDDVALAAGSQCIEYELEYEEQQNPPDTAAIMSTASSIYMTENTSYSEETITTTNQDEETVTYHMQSDDLLNTTSTISTDDLQKEDLTSLLTTEIIQEPTTNIAITTNNIITDEHINQTDTNQSTQTTFSIITFQTTSNDQTTMHQSDITLGPKMTILPLTTPQVITILPPTTSTVLKQRTPETTVQIATNVTINPTTSLVRKNNTTLPPEIPFSSTKTFLSTENTSLESLTKLVTTTVQNTTTSQPPTPPTFTPPPPPILPPHPFSVVSTSTAISTQKLIPDIRTESSDFYFLTNYTEPSSTKLTTHVSSSISSSSTLPSPFLTTVTSHTTHQIFTPPPPPPLPPHPFSELTAETMITEDMSDITLNPITSDKNNISYSYTSTTSSKSIQSSTASTNNETHISFPETTALFSQATFFTDTTTHATTTLSTNEINSKPATVNEGTTSAIPTTITKKITPSTSMDILTTPELTTVEKTVTKTSSLSANSSSTVVPEIITTSTPDVSSTSNIGKTTSEDVKNKTSKYSKGALLAIAVLILVLCILGVIAISVVIKKYREYAKEDKLLENSEGSNTSIRFSYRREGGGRGGGGGRVGPEVGLPTVNFYGYENPGTPV